MHLLLNTPSQHTTPSSNISFLIHLLPTPSNTPSVKLYQHTLFKHPLNTLHAHNYESHLIITLFSLVHAAMKQREADLRQRIHSLVHGDDNVDLGVLRDALEEGRQTFNLVDLEAEQYLTEAHEFFQQVSELTRSMEQTIATVRELQELDPNGRCPDARKYQQRLRQGLTTMQGWRLVSARLMRRPECPTADAIKVFDLTCAAILVVDVVSLL